MIFGLIDLTHHHLNSTCLCTGGYSGSSCQMTNKKYGEQGYSMVDLVKIGVYVCIGAATVTMVVFLIDRMA